MTRKGKYFFIAPLLCSVLPAGLANAHASEQGLVLLLPTEAYAAAGTLTVIASIILVTCLPGSVLERLFGGVRFGGAGQGRKHSPSVYASFAFSIALLFLVYVGLQGPTDPQSNLLPLTIWTVWWIGVFVVQGILFDIWKWVNPWTGVIAVFGLGDRPILKFPEWLATWPAVAMLICFQLFLLADIAPSDPQRLGAIVLGYWIVTLIGIELFGKKDWLGRVECFSVMFRLIGWLRPLQYGGQVQFGFAGWLALRRAPLDLSCAVFCLVILSSGSFDGVNETFWWLAQIGINPLEFPGRSVVIWSSTLGLFAAILLLIAVFGMAIKIGLLAVQAHGQTAPPKLPHAFNMFAVTLLPIALGYHFAHYLVTFMVQIKFTLSTAADPLALGWNLFGLGAIKATVGFLSVPETVKAIWLTQAGVVVFSHVVSVLMSHHIASKLCSNNRDVVLIQIGLTALMIAYTVFGLWLLASPRGV
ncbi:MAG: hypothetical protein ABJL67_10880 [Sulfitobacter sp.]